MEICNYCNPWVGVLLILVASGLAWMFVSMAFDAYAGLTGRAKIRWDMPPERRASNARLFLF